MKFSIQQEVLLQPISQVIGVVERRQTLPVLANFLVSAQGKRLSITGTDMEVELIASVERRYPVGRRDYRTSQKTGRYRA